MEGLEAQLCACDPYFGIMQMSGVGGSDKLRLTAFARTKVTRPPLLSSALTMSRSSQSELSDLSVALNDLFQQKSTPGDGGISEHKGRTTDI
jgi:hypothetical protein